MSKILVNGEWFEKLSPLALYEKEYERIILQQAAKIFPQYHLVRFDILVYDEYEGAKADLALIHRGYKEWWVVEVEKGDHPFQSHVLPQVKTLSNAKYGQEAADQIKRGMPSLDYGQLMDMLKGKQPGVIVLVDDLKPEWMKPLSSYGTILTVIEVYRSQKNQHIFRINGDQPVQPLDSVTVCTVDPLLRNLLKVESPAGLDTPTGGRIVLRFDGELTEWERIDAQDSVWLQPLGHNPFPPKTICEILRSLDGSLIIRPRPSR